MKTSGFKVASLLLICLVLCEQTSQTSAYKLLPLGKFKRSLCNTFGGCGEKRSISSIPEDNPYYMAEISGGYNGHNKATTSIMEESNNLKRNNQARARALLESAKWNYLINEDSKDTGKLFIVPGDTAGDPMLTFQQYPRSQSGVQASP